MIDQIDRAIETENIKIQQYQEIEKNHAIIEYLKNIHELNQYLKSKNINIEFIIMPSEKSYVFGDKSPEGCRKRGCVEISNIAIFYSGFEKQEDKILVFDNNNLEKISIINLKDKRYASAKDFGFEKFRANSQDVKSIFSLLDSTLYQAPMAFIALPLLILSFLLIIFTLYISAYPYSIITILNEIQPEYTIRRIISVITSMGTILGITYLGIILPDWVREKIETKIIHHYHQAIKETT